MRKVRKAYSSFRVACQLVTGCTSDFIFLLSLVGHT